MSGEALAVLLSKLNSCEEAADIMYSTDAAQTLNSGAAGSALPASVNSTAASANREEVSVIVARRIDSMVARLNDLASPASQVVLTPRMVLCELMDILRQALFTSLPVEMQSAVALTDKAGVVRQFNAYVSARQVPVTAAAEALHTVSYVSVKLRVELVALQLRRRVQAELQKKDTQASEESVAALVVTETLLDDLMAIYNNIVLTLPVTKAAGAVGSSAADSVAVAAAVERLVPVFEHYFYQLCDWVLVLESTMQGPVMSYTQVKRLTADEQRGTAVVDLHRPTAQTAWGLLLNERGCLVDIDVSLRVFDKAKQLHRLLQAAPQGAQIIKINDKPIPGARTSSSSSSSATADGSAHAQAVVAALQAATASRKNVQLTLQSPAFKSAARTMATEVAFVAPPQGGEGTAGQRVTLVLRRQSTTAAWGFTVDDRLYWHHPPLRILSEPAKAFVKDYGRHLRLLAVNGVEALHPSQVELLVAAAETVVLELLVMPSFTESRRAAAPSSSPTGAPPAAIDSSAVKNAVAAAPKVKRGSDNAAGDAWMEAAVAKLLKGQASESASTAVGSSGGAVDAAHPSSQDPASSLAASPAVAASEGLAPAVAEAAVALETPLVDAVMHRPSLTAAAGVATVAKRGRPPKTVATNDAAAAAAAAVPVSSPTAEASGKEGKRGRPRKTTPQESNAASVVEEAQLKKSVEAVAEPDGSPASSSSSLTRKNKKSGGTSDAAACVFDNKVRLLQLSEAEMVLERPTTDMPWGLPIGRISDTAASPQQLPLRLMSLPPAKSSSSRAHPFLTQFKKEPATWFIAEVNGKPATNAETTLKAIGKLTRMTLRFVRK